MKMKMKMKAESTAKNQMTSKGVASGSETYYLCLHSPFVKQKVLGISN